jgi:hypothetical protein
VPIRQHRPSTDEFVEEFQKTIVPSAIPSSDFIDWNRIESQIANYSSQIETLHELKGVGEEEFEKKVADALMGADDTRKWVDFDFDLLGERGNTYSA